MVLSKDHFVKKVERPDRDILHDAIIKFKIKFKEEVVGALVGQKFDVGVNSDNSDMYEAAMYEAAKADYAKYVTNKKREKVMRNELSVYEYVVVLRATEDQKKSGQKDSIIIGPKSIMATDVKEVEKIAIREVPGSVENLSLVEVYVRPFVG